MNAQHFGQVPPSRPRSHLQRIYELKVPLRQTLIFLQRLIHMNIFLHFEEGNVNYF